MKTIYYLLRLPVRKIWLILSGRRSEILKADPTQETYWQDERV